MSFDNFNCTEFLDLDSLNSNDSNTSVIKKLIKINKENYIEKIIKKYYYYFFKKEIDNEFYQILINLIKNGDLVNEKDIFHEIQAAHYESKFPSTDDTNW